MIFPGVKCGQKHHRPGYKTSKGSFVIRFKITIVVAHVIVVAHI